MTPEMSRAVFVTCAVAGSGATQALSPHVLQLPAETVESAVDAASADAATVHCHVLGLDPDAPRRQVALYRERIGRIRAAGTDVVRHLTTGMGGDLVLGGPGAPLALADGTDMATADERLATVAACRCESCTLDCGMVILAGADQDMANMPACRTSWRGGSPPMGSGPRSRRSALAICGMSGGWQRTA